MGRSLKKDSGAEPWLIFTFLDPWPFSIVQDYLGSNKAVALPLIKIIYSLHLVDMFSERALLGKGSINRKL